MSKSKNVVKKLTTILFTILFTLVSVFAIGPTNVNAETTDITEINLTGNYQYGTVPAGILPSFNPETTTNGISIGSNSAWAYYKSATSVWSGFGSETPVAYNDGTTKYGYRFQVRTNSGYKIASDFKVIYNGNDVTSSVEVLTWPWGAYVTVDLGKAIGESPATYTVTFNSNGGTEIAPKEVVSGLKIGEPSIPTKKGFTFDGWYEEATLNTKFDFNTPITSNRTLYAKWEAANSINEIRLVGDFQYGNVPVGTLPSFNPRTITDSISIGSNSAWAYYKSATSVWSGFGSETPVAYNDGTTKYGYRFQVRTNSGYKIASDFKVIYNGNDVTSSVEVLTWPWGAYVTVDLGKAIGESPATYTVTFNSNGGTEIAPKEVVSGLKIGEPSIPTKKGFTFDGWYEEATLNTKFDFNTPITSNRTLYANWIENKYTLTFDANGGSGTMTPVTDLTGEYTLPANEFTAPSGKQFKGWSLTTDGAIVTKVDMTENRTVYAIWEHTHTLTSVPEKAATCTDKGNHAYYTCTCGKWFADESGTVEITNKKIVEIASLNHDWNAPAYTWNADNTVCTATRTCKRDAGHKETATATVTSAQTKAPTCTAKGETTYTAAFTEAWANTQTKTVDNIAPLNHDWNAPAYTWNADNTVCTATRTCKRDAGHKETATATVTSAQTKAPTCTAKGETTYTAAFTEAWANTQTKTVDNIAALGHDWSTAWTGDSTGHWHKCTRCDATTTKAAHDYGSDNVCDTCGYDKTVPHTHNLTLVAAKAATCTTAGNSAYYTCDGCDKWFEDATGSVEITNKSSVKIPATGHTAGEWIVDTPATATTAGTKHKECTVCHRVLETQPIPSTGTELKIIAGDNQIYNKASGSDVTITCNGDFAKFTGIKVDGSVVDSSNYTAVSGSTVLTLKASYLGTLTDGSHTITFVYTDGEANVNLTVRTAGSEHIHDYGTEWKSNADNHWHECNCGDKKDEAAHSFKWVIDKAATKVATGIKHEECTVCGAKRSENTVIDKLHDGGNTGNTSSGDNNTNKPGKDDSTKSSKTGDSNNLIGWLAVLFVSGGVLTVLGLNGKKRKESEAE